MRESGTSLANASEVFGQSGTETRVENDLQPSEASP